MTWQPVPGHIMTRWAKDVSAENAWPEYPRPQMRRSEWANLNGTWDYAITQRRAILEESGDIFGAAVEAARATGEILVPFPIESALSGVKRSLGEEELLWYRRTFQVPGSWMGRRVLLHFGAVDWEAKVFVNGRLAGEHTGGYLPFWFDITHALKEGENELVVRVWDPTDSHWQQRGKQVRKPQTIWYTAVSGIWQTAWLEPIPETYIAQLKITPDVDGGAVRVKVLMAGMEAGKSRVSVSVSADEAVVAEGEGMSTEEICLRVPEARSWSPDSPFLYELEIRTGEDRVESYFGMRKFSVEKGRLCLNNEPLFQLGPLDQGYWPEGLYTPPTDEAMREDIALVKKLGFNMLRKHVKVEPARYYAYCDRMGLIVWQDMPNGGAVANEIRFFLFNKIGISPSDHNYRMSGREQADSRTDYLRELQEMVDTLYNATCIGMWVPFNEGWGQFDAKATAEWLNKYDPTRSVDHASGWFDKGGGDVRSLHDYFRKLRVRKPGKRRALVLSEFGAFSLKIEGHLWDPDSKFGYINFPTKEKLTEAYVNLIQNEIKPWVEAGLSAAIYTQTTDVEIEVNGFVTYDREVEKMDLEKVRAVHRLLS